MTNLIRIRDEIFGKSFGENLHEILTLATRA